MKNVLTFTALVLGLAVSANAQEGQYPNSGSATLWSCGKTTGTMSYCTARVTSGTTAANLGTINLDAKKAVNVIFTANNSAVSGLVTSTINLKLKGKAVGSVASVSATSAGNRVGVSNLTSNPGWFDGASVSVTVPSTISDTNSLQITVTQ